MINLLRSMRLKDRALILVVVALVSLQTYLDLKLPDYMAEITMLVQSEGSVMSDIYSAGLKMMFCAIGGFILAIFIITMASKIASNFSYQTRTRMFEKVMSFSMKEVNSFSISSLITRTTNDITQVQLLIVMGTQMLIKAPITAIMAIIKIYNKNLTWTGVTAVAVVVLIIIVSICLSLAIPRFKRIQGLTDNINKVSKETLDGLNVVRAYNAEDYQGAKFEDANQEMLDTNLFAARTMSFLMPSIQMVSSGLLLGIYFAGAIMINDAIGMDKLTLFSDMVVFSSYATQIIFAFMMLIMVFMMMPRAAVSAVRINEVLSTPNTIIPGTVTSGATVGQVEFRNVNFKYPGAESYVLKDINFTAQKGETIAFIGSTGCGKTSLINLIPRFYDVSDGEVLVNGVNVKDYSKNALNKMIGYVSQRSILFTGTIKSNITFGDNSSVSTNDADLSAAVEVSQAADFVDKQEQKYESYVAQGGRNFSGGQKQRISIARAIFRKPDIFIFDDSFSALDYKTDRVLRETLNKRCGDSTMLIVGQRIGTIKNADKIVVLEDGQIVGQGTHSELLANCETYKQIALSQLSEEELKNA